MNFSVPTRQTADWSIQEKISEARLMPLKRLTIGWLGTSGEYTAEQLPDGSRVGLVKPSTFYHERREMRLTAVRGSWVETVRGD
jgi:hypothetical protein